MPHRVITAPGYDRDKRGNRVLWVALWWLETFVVYGPGDVEGQPIRLSDERAGFIMDCYALDAAGRRLHNSAFFSRPKGCDKSGLAGYLVLLEALGPCRFEGWAKGGETYTFLGRTYTYRQGEPMGRPVHSPVIRIVATEEDQAGNIFDNVLTNLDPKYGHGLSQLVAYGLKVTQTEIGLPGGGKITPSSSGADSKDGGKETFVAFDETHLYTSNGLRRMYKTTKRNLRKRRASAGTWLLETTTMYEPGTNSIAEDTYSFANEIQEGRAKRGRLLFDHRWAELDDLSDEDALADAIAEAYGDALEWNSVSDVIDDIFDPRQSESESKRYSLNTLVEGDDAWITPQDWQAVLNRKQRARPGDRITLGFDGSVDDDATALVACSIDHGHLWPILIDEIPDGPEARGWSVNVESFNKAVAWAFETFDVVGFFADPPYWQEQIEDWAKNAGDRLQVKASTKHSIKFWTTQTNRMSDELERLHTAIRRHEDVSHEGVPSLSRHMLNARNREYSRFGRRLIGKRSKKSPHKIDAAMAATLAYAARAQYLAEVQAQPEVFVPRRIERKERRGVR
ncbi:terminase large subunit domain-containing protein [Brachybacterium kimchii]|uniref:Phage terminase family protein n=1 Tax=Brachybacterium kimchii TaxID=2942909 RepID=A0ABY4N7Y5_9MICO|nr:terminase large subunit [Brachybacterium kimchii]UQN30666.1 phage terminase family protein [Brachybacterium kimchii]